MSERTFELTPRKLAVGTIMTVTGAVLWGVNGTVSKILMDSYRVDPTWVACVREIVAGLLFLACAGVATPKLLGGMLRERKNYPMLVIVALSSVLVIQVGYLQAIHWTNAGTATVLQSLSLLFVLLYVCVHGRRLPTVIETIGVILAVIGTVLIATGGNLSSISLPLPGLAWGLANALGNAAMAIIPLALIARWGAFSVNGVAFLISRFVLVPFVRPWAHMPQLDARGWLMLGFLVVIGTFAACGLYMGGVAIIGSMRGILIGTIEPVVATVTAVTWTGAAFSPADLVGLVLIILMVFLVR